MKHLLPLICFGAREQSAAPMLASDCAKADPQAKEPQNSFLNGYKVIRKSNNPLNGLLPVRLTPT
jgi:hypothetical protein